MDRYSNVNRDPFQFVGSREVQVKGAQTPIDFWNYIFPRNFVQTIVYETNRCAEMYVKIPILVSNIHVQINEFQQMLTK
jgi:hypothetical protein